MSFRVDHNKVNKTFIYVEKGKGKRGGQCVIAQQNVLVGEFKTILYAKQINQQNECNKKCHTQLKGKRNVRPEIGPDTLKNNQIISPSIVCAACAQRKNSEERGRGKERERGNCGPHKLRTSATIIRL